jgi:hypothetical protein
MKHLLNTLKPLLKKKWIPVCIVLITLATIAPSYREWFVSKGDWIYEDTDGMENQFYRDDSYVKRRGDSVTYRQKIQYGPELIYQLTKITGTLTLLDVQDVVINCKDRTIRQAHLKRENIVPGHRLEASYNALCNSGGRHARKITPKNPAAQMPETMQEVRDIRQQQSP